MVVTILGSLLFVKQFQIPSGNEWYSVCGIGIFGLIGQVFMTKAFQNDEASVLAPFKYMELVYALGFGFVFFGETYNLLSAVGIFFIVLGMVLNVKLKS